MQGAPALGTFSPIQAKPDNSLLGEEPLLQDVYRDDEDTSTYETSENFGQAIENENSNSADQKKSSIPKKSSVDGIAKPAELWCEEGHDYDGGYGHNKGDAITNYPFVCEPVLVYPFSKPFVSHQVTYFPSGEEHTPNDPDYEYKLDFRHLDFVTSFEH